MSGIAGLYNLDGRAVEQAALDQVMSVLEHRGPDRAGFWCEGSIGLIHRMLWTTPESLLEQLPGGNHQETLVITADARIDNRDELISALDLGSDRPVEKITDSDLILAAYEKWNEHCVEQLVGDFAFAIWDKQRQQLFCARDHFGIKPFYYHYQAQKAFYFASEIKGLLCLPGVPQRINERKIAAHLTLMLDDKAITCYETILRLPPAHTMTVSREYGVRMHCYWQLDPSREICMESDEEYAKAFREIFTEAVRCRLRSAFPVGTHLSGGLDSSSIACVARNLLQAEGARSLHVFSNVFDVVKECDEREFINPVLEQGGFIPHYLHPDQTGPLSEWQILLQPTEEPPLSGGNGYLVWNLHRAARAVGIRVSLDGFDGDTTVCHGFNSFAEWARQGNWSRFASEAHAVSQHFATSSAAILRQFGFNYLKQLACQWRWLAFYNAIEGMRKHFKVSRKLLWWHCGLKPLVPAPVLGFWRWLRGTTTVEEISQVINSSFAQRMGVNEQHPHEAAVQEALLSVREGQWRTLTSGAFTHILELQDVAAAACSIEARHPFMDKRLIEFCLALPSHQKLHQGWSRIVMRRAMDGILPEKVQWRGGKMDVGSNFLYGLLNFNRDLVDEVVFRDSGSMKAYVDLIRLRRAYNSLTSDANPSEEDVWIVWAATALALWLRQAGLTSSVSPA